MTGKPIKCVLTLLFRELHPSDPDRSPRGIVDENTYHRVLHSGGPDGEIAASMRYLSQRFTMPNRMATAVLNDVGTCAEEMSYPLCQTKTDIPANPGRLHWIPSLMVSIQARRGLF